MGERSSTVVTALRPGNVGDDTALNLLFCSSIQDRIRLLLSGRSTLDEFVTWFSTSALIEDSANQRVTVLLHRLADGADPDAIYGGLARLLHRLDAEKVVEVT